MGNAGGLVLGLGALEPSNWPLFVDQSRVGGTLRSPRGVRLRGVCGAALRGEGRSAVPARVPAPPRPPRAPGAALSARPAAAAHLAGAGGERVGGLPGWRWRSAVQWGASPAPYMVGD